jgi:translocation and assembly module TamB
VAVQLIPSATPARLPEDLQLPLGVVIHQLSIGRVDVSGAAQLPPIRDLHARFISNGRDHRLEDVAFDSAIGPVQASAALAGRKPFVFQAEVSAPREPLGLVARASGTLADFGLAAEARGRALSGHFYAHVTPFEPIPLSGLQANIDTLRPAAFIAGLPDGVLSLTAQGALQKEAGRWQFRGPFNLENQHPAPLDQHGWPFSSARGELIVSDQGVLLEQLVATVEGGVLQGRASLLQHHIEAELTARDLPLQALSGALQRLRVSGQVQLKSSAAHQWAATGRLQHARGQARFAATLEGSRVLLQQAELASGQARAAVSGSFDLSGTRAFSLQARLRDFNPADWVKAPVAKLNVDVDATGHAAPTPRARVNFDLRNSTLTTAGGTRPLAGQGRLFISGQGVEEVSLTLDLAGNRVAARGAFGRPQDVLQLTLDMPALQHLGVGVEGAVKGEVRLEGSVQAPALAIDLESPSFNVGASGWQGLQIKGTLAPGQSGALSLKARVGEVKSGTLGVLARGEIALQGTRSAHEAQLLATLSPRWGGGQLDASARGGLAQGLNWRGMLMSLRHQGARLPFTLAAPAQLILTPAEVALGEARLQGTTAHAQLSDTRWHAGQFSARGALSGLKVSAKQWVEGGLTLGARWDVKWGASREGRVSVFREAGDIALGGDAPVSLGLSVLRSDFTLSGSRLNATLEARGQRLGQIEGTFAASLGEGARLLPEAPLSGRLHLSLPALDWVGPLIDPNIKTAGRLSGEMHLAGTPAAPHARGEITGEQLVIALIDQGLRLQQGTLRLSFDQARATLQELRFVSPARPAPRGAPFSVNDEPGQLQVSGLADLAKMQASFDFSAERVLALAREGRWLMASGSGKLGLTPEGARLEGRTRVDAAAIAYTPTLRAGLDDDVIVRGRSTPAPRRLHLAVDLLADLGERCYFSAKGLNARLTGEVRLRTQGQAPLVAHGAIGMVDGVYDAYGQTLAIERGRVSFQGPLDNPALNVRAVRRGLPVEAGVEVTGSAQAPRVRLVSEPPVPDAEKLSWIVLGRGLDQAASGGGTDSGVLLAAAGAILGGGDGRGVPQQLASALGFDQISVGPGEREGMRGTTTVAGSLGAAREPGVSSTVVQIGKRLSSNAYLSYEHSLLGLESALKLTYALTRRLSLVGRAGTDNSLDLMYTFSFD